MNKQSWSVCLVILWLAEKQLWWHFQRRWFLYTKESIKPDIINLLLIYELQMKNGWQWTCRSRCFMRLIINNNNNNNDNNNFLIKDHLRRYRKDTSRYKSLYRKLHQNGNLFWYRTPLELFINIKDINIISCFWHVTF